MAIGWSPVADLDILPSVEGLADCWFRVSGGGQMPGRKLKIAVERGLELTEQRLCRIFGAGLLQGGEVAT